MSANLKGVDLEWVSGLTAKQISNAIRDESTKLPDAVIKEMRSIDGGI